MSDTFSFKDLTLNYLHSEFPQVRANERTVEVPIVMHYINKYRGKRILEVGNVIAQYYTIPHTVVDKYDISANVINEDIVDFWPEDRFDLIFSISTLEHVNLDKSIEVFYAKKSVKALSRMKQLCEVGGLILVTIPFGFNKSLDKLIMDGEITFNQTVCLKRIGYSEWVEVPYREAVTVSYSSPYPAANAILVGFIGGNI